MRADNCGGEEVRRRFEAVFTIIVEAEDAESAKCITEEVMPHMGYSSDDAEIVDVMLTGEPMEVA